MAYTSSIQRGVSDPGGNRQHPSDAGPEGRLFSEGERLIGAERHASKEEIKRVVNGLINIYDNPLNGREIREKAFRLVICLAKQDDLALDCVIINARRFIETQYIDDASPYSPNSFDVLSEVGEGSSKLISFLKDTLQNEWGIPRWEAIKALCKLNDPQADRIINDLIQGAYPPKFLDSRIDLAKIKALRPGFLKTARCPLTGAD